MFIVIDRVYRHRHERAQTVTSSPLCASKHAHTPPASFDHVSSRNDLHGRGAVLTSGYWIMVSLYNINLESVFDGQQRRLDDFQFDLENVLTPSQLVGMSAEERNAAAGMLEILACAKNKTAAEVAAYVVTDATRNGQSAVRGACGKHCWTSQSDRA